MIRSEHFDSQPLSLTPSPAKFSEGAEAKMADFRKRIPEIAGMRHEPSQSKAFGVADPDFEFEGRRKPDTSDRSYAWGQGVSRENVTQDADRAQQEGACHSVVAWL